MSTLRVSAIKLRDNAAWRLAVMCSLLSLSVAVAFGQPGGNVSLSNGYPGYPGQPRNRVVKLARRLQEPSACGRAAPSAGAF